MFYYLKVEWIHNHIDDPLYLYSELDYERNENRKVYIYPDGKIDFACKDFSGDNVFLSMEPIPSNEIIALDNQFKLENISKADFEKIWSLAINSNETNKKIPNFDKMSPKEIVNRSYDKIYWEQGAERLKLLKLTQIYSIILDLFKWLQDLNWPGTIQVMDLLAVLPRQVLIINLEAAIKVALIDNDHDWLYFISMFIKIKNIDITRNDFKDKEIYDSFILSINNY